MVPVQAAPARSATPTPVYGFAIPVDGQIGEVHVVGDVAYASIPGLNQVVTIDYAGFAVVDTHDFGGSVRALESSSDGSLLYIGNSSTGKVIEYDPGTKSTIRSFNTGQDLGSRRIWDLQRVGTDLYVTNNQSGAPIGRIDLATGAVDVVGANGTADTRPPMFWDGADRIYIAEQSAEDHLLEMDISLPGAPIVGEAPDGVACKTEYSAVINGGAEIVTGCGEILSTNDFQLVDTIAEGFMTTNRAGTKLFSANVNANELVDIVRIDPVTRTVEKLWQTPCDADATGLQRILDFDVVAGNRTFLVALDGDDAVCVVTFDAECNGLSPTVLPASTRATNLILTEGADVFLGTSGRDIVRALGGNDTICTFGGDDQIEPGTGNDWVDAGTGPADLLDVKFSLQAVNINLAAEKLTGYGTDTIIGFEHVNGTNHDDTIIGNAADNYIEAGNGDDFVNGKQGDDVIEGQDGDNVLVGGPGDDQLDRGILLDGGPGNDFLKSGTPTYQLAPQGVVVDLPNNVITGWGTDTLNNVSNVIGSPFDDVMQGDHQKNTLVGLEGDDEIRGGGNGNILDGGPGKDAIWGGPANDEIYGGAQPDVIRGGGGDDVIDGGNGNDRIWGQAGADVIDGWNGADIIHGGPGSDLLVGWYGHDTLNGDDGPDLLAGEAGNDQLNGGNGVDAVSQLLSPNGVILNLRTGTSTGEGTDTLTSIQDAIGSNFDDQITGNGLVNVLLGADGDDVIVGKGANDEIDAGDGIDDVRGGLGIDLCLNAETTNQCELFVLPAFDRTTALTLLVTHLDRRRTAIR